MAQSLVKNYLHIVFSTKNRTPWIKPPVEEELYKYMAELCYEWNSPPIIVGGYIDHVHICCSLSKNIALMTLLQKVKAYSSKWIKSKGEDYKDFTWQRGYAAFSVDYDRLHIVKKYIKNQHQHHQGESFKDEVRRLLNQNNIEFDERYIWD